MLSFWCSGNAITDEGFEGIAEAILAGALPELVYLNVDGMIL